MNIDHLSVRTVQMTPVKRRKCMTAGENVLLNTMKLDKTVNQQRRSFIPKEGEKNTHIYTRILPPSPPTNTHLHYTHTYTALKRPPTVSDEFPGPKLTTLEFN